MNVLHIIRDMLKIDGYDGLVNAGCCACLVDDLAPCEGEIGHCEPGHRVNFKDGDCDDDAGCDGNCDWHIVSGK